MSKIPSKKYVMKNITTNLRHRPGHITACTIFSGLFIYTYTKGPKIESQNAKYILAGTTALLGVELGCHFIDTMNMKSKVIKPQKYKSKVKGSFIWKIFSPAYWRGYQLVIHGYFLPCLVFFYVQLQGKIFTRDHLTSIKVDQL